MSETKVGMQIAMDSAALRVEAKALAEEFCEPRWPERLNEWLRDGFSAEEIAELEHLEDSHGIPGGWVKVAARRLVDAEQVRLGRTRGALASEDVVRLLVRWADAARYGGGCSAARELLEELEGRIDARIAAAIAKAGQK